MPLPENNILFYWTAPKRASFLFPFRIILPFILFQEVLFRVRTGVRLLYLRIILLPVYRICQFLLAGVEAYLMQALHGVLAAAQPVHPSSVIGDIEFRRIVVQIQRFPVVVRFNPVGQPSLRVSAQNFGNAVHFDLRQQLAHLIRIEPARDIRRILSLYRAQHLDLSDALRLRRRRIRHEPRRERDARRRRGERVSQSLFHCIPSSLKKQTAGAKVCFHAGG